MQLRDLGEFGVIERIRRAARRSPSGTSVVLGIGDDAALLRPRNGEDVVVSTDALVEGVHFRWNTQSPRTIGQRALVANLSDLAAMGARPLGCVLALSAPPDLDVRRLDGVIGGLLRAANQHECPLVGGNIARSRQTSLALTVIGAVERGRALRRDRAKPGDRICVTGALGAVALDVARAKRGVGDVRNVPTPRLRAGRALSRCSGIGGVIDISDGLLADLEHVMTASGCHADLNLESVPLARGLRPGCARLGIDPLRLATTGGEDLELLFTVRSRGPSSAQLTQRLGVAVTQIGRVLAGTAPTAKDSGWRHF